MNPDNYETIPVVASLDAILEAHADGYTSVKGKIVKRGWHLDTMKGSVVFLLTVDKSKPSDAAP